MKIEGRTQFIESYVTTVQILIFMLRLQFLNNLVFGAFPLGIDFCTLLSDLLSHLFIFILFYFLVFLFERIPLMETYFH